MVLVISYNYIIDDMEKWYVGSNYSFMPYLKVKARINYYIPQKTVDVTTYPYLIKSLLIKGAPFEQTPGWLVKLDALTLV